MSDAPRGGARIGVLLSGRGSNFLALHRAIHGPDAPGEAGRDPRFAAAGAEIAVVLSNVAGAPGVEKARDLGLAVELVPHRGLARAEHDERVLAALRPHDVEWICLAGYMRILGEAFVEAYPERILNVHPSLLPSFPGLHAQRQAWDYGVRVSGCTVHLVDAGLDSGPIVAQAAVEVAGCGDADELASRILEEEHRLYPRALARLLAEDWSVRGRRVVFASEASGGKKSAESRPRP